MLRRTVSKLIKYMISTDAKHLRKGPQRARPIDAVSRLHIDSAGPTVFETIQLFILMS